jgi:hypothetical protein
MAVSTALACWSPTRLSPTNTAWIAPLLVEQVIRRPELIVYRAPISEIVVHHGKMSQPKFLDLSHHIDLDLFMRELRCMQPITRSPRPLTRVSIDFNQGNER